MLCCNPLLLFRDIDRCHKDGLDTGAVLQGLKKQRKSLLSDNNSLHLCLVDNLDQKFAASQVVDGNSHESVSVERLLCNERFY